MDPATCAATRYANQLHATVERLAIGRRWPLVLSEGNVHLPTGHGIAGLLVAAEIGRRLQAAASSTPTPSALRSPAPPPSALRFPTPPALAPRSPAPPTPAPATSALPTSALPRPALPRPAPPAPASDPHPPASPASALPVPSAPAWTLPAWTSPASALPALALSTELWAFLVDSDEIDRAGAVVPDLPPQVRLVHGGRYLPLPPSVTADGPVRWVREPGDHLPRLATVLRLLRPLTPTTPRHARR